MSSSGPRYVQRQRAEGIAGGGQRTSHNRLLACTHSGNSSTDLKSIFGFAVRSVRSSNRGVRLYATGRLNPSLSTVYHPLSDVRSKIASSVNGSEGGAMPLAGLPPELTIAASTPSSSWEAILSAPLSCGPCPVAAGWDRLRERRILQPQHGRFPRPFA